jgi:hypothetical protein
MTKPLRLLTLCASIACVAVGAGSAYADPGEEHGHDDIPVPPPSLPTAPPGIEGMGLLDLADKDGVTNSDLAFYGNYAYAGNYDGFRIIDISRPGLLEVVSDVKCRAVQSDVSVVRARGGRMILLQSIDRPVTTPGCDAVDTEVVEEPLGEGTAKRARFGYEGLRMFDVTNPREPRFMRFIRTEAGRTRTRSSRAVVAGRCSRTSPRTPWASASPRRSTRRLRAGCAATHRIARSRSCGSRPPIPRRRR